MPAGSRNSLTSILYGLHRYPPKSLERIILLNIAPNLEKKEAWMQERLKVCGVDRLSYDFTTYDVFADGYTNYSKLMPFAYNELKFHPRYEGKCWNYINDHFSTFKPYINDKTLFWIVGSEPKSCAGQDGSSGRSASIQLSFQARS